MIPDFSFEKEGMKAYLEVVGFWTENYLTRKIQKLDDIDRRLSQLGEASLSKVTELMQDIGVGAPNQVLEALGYEVKWYGLDQDKAIISKSKTQSTTKP